MFLWNPGYYRDSLIKNNLKIFKIQAHRRYTSPCGAGGSCDRRELGGEQCSTYPPRWIAALKTNPCLQSRSITIEPCKTVFRLDNCCELSLSGWQGLGGSVMKHFKYTFGPIKACLNAEVISDDLPVTEIPWISRISSPTWTWDLQIRIFSTSWYKTCNDDLPAQTEMPQNQEQLILQTCAHLRFLNAIPGYHYHRCPLFFV